MEYIRIAKVTDFDASPMRTYRVMARRLGIFRAPDGSFSAMEMVCRHQNADLTTGRVQGDVVTCPRHGWRYNLKRGSASKATVNVCDATASKSRVGLSTWV